MKYPSIHPFIHPSINQSFHPSTNPSIHSIIHLSINPSIHLSFHSSFNSSIHPSFYSSTLPFIHQSFHLSIHQSILSSIHESILSSINSSIHLNPSILPFILHSIHPPIHPSILPIILPSFHPPMHPSVVFLRTDCTCCFCSATAHRERDSRCRTSHSNLSSSRHSTLQIRCLAYQLPQEQPTRTLVGRPTASIPVLWDSTQEPRSLQTISDDEACSWRSQWLILVYAIRGNLPICLYRLISCAILKIIVQMI